jgi:hypothetical protein
MKRCLNILTLLLAGSLSNASQDPVSEPATFYRSGKKLTVTDKRGSFRRSTSAKQLEQDFDQSLANHKNVVESLPQLPQKIDMATQTDSIIYNSTDTQTDVVEHKCMEIQTESIQEPVITPQLTEKISLSDAQTQTEESLVAPSNAQKIAYRSLDWAKNLSLLFVFGFTYQKYGFQSKPAVDVILQRITKGSLAGALGLTGIATISYIIYLANKSKNK